MDKSRIKTLIRRAADINKAIDIANRIELIENARCLWSDRQWTDLGGFAYLRHDIFKLCILKGMDHLQTELEQELESLPVFDSLIKPDNSAEKAGINADEWIP